MTPLEIEVMLGCFYFADKSDRIGRGNQSLAHQQAFGMLKNKDMINSKTFTATEKGKAYVEKLCSISPPKAVTTWVFEEG